MSCFAPVLGFNAENISKSSLIIPMVSIGNVPQLTIDLFIHTLGFERVGFLDTDTLIPVAGLREDNQTGTTAPIEVYQSQCRNWTLIQQRSPAMRGKRAKFVADLVQFALEFERVFLLSSLDATSRIDAQINNIPFCAMGKDTTRSVELGVPLLDDSNLNLYGAGLTRHLYEKLREKATVFMMYALEGGKLI